VFRRYFTVVGPRTVQRNKDYKAHVIYKGNQPILLKLTLTGLENEEEEEGEIKFTQTDEKTVTFPVNKFLNISKISL
jgi:hypothetical protein